MIDETFKDKISMGMTLEEFDALARSSNSSAIGIGGFQENGDPTGMFLWVNDPYLMYQIFNFIHDFTNQGGAGNDARIIN